MWEFPDDVKVIRVYFLFSLITKIMEECKTDKPESSYPRLSMIVQVERDQTHAEHNYIDIYTPFKGLESF